MPEFKYLPDLGFENCWTYGFLTGIRSLPNLQIPIGSLTQCMRILISSQSPKKTPVYVSGYHSVHGFPFCPTHLTASAPHPTLFPHPSETTKVAGVVSSCTTICKVPPGRKLGIFQGLAHFVSLLLDHRPRLSVFNICI